MQVLCRSEFTGVRQVMLLRLRLRDSLTGEARGVIDQID